MIKGKSDEQLLAKFDQRLQQNKCYKKSKFGGAKQFTVSHYADDVAYDIEGFLQKNIDQVFDLVNHAIQTSENMVLNHVIPQVTNASKSTSSLKVDSLFKQFNQQLNELVATLSEAEPCFIRCIKPNVSNQADNFNSAFVLQ